MKIKACVGIYGLKCTVTGKWLVGSSIRCRNRCRTHLNKLVRGKHVNRYLQAAWQKYGAEAFEFMLLEECAESDLKAREQWWINNLQSHLGKYGYNIAAAVRQDIPAEGMSKIIKAHWGGLTEKQRAKRDAHKRTREGRARLRQNAVDLWADPEYRELMSTKVSATMIELCKDPKVRKLRTEASNGYWSTNAAREKMSARMRAQWAKLSPEERSKRSKVKPRETTRFVTLKGVTKSLKEWVALSGLPYGLLLTRLSNGYDTNQLFQPSYKYKVSDEFAKEWLAKRIRHPIID